MWAKMLDSENMFLGLKYSRLSRKNKTIVKSAAFMNFNWLEIVKFLLGVLLSHTAYNCLCYFSGKT